MKTSFVRAAFVASLLCTTAIGSAILPAGTASAADHLSNAVAKPLSEAKKLMDTNDFQGALAKVKEAQAASSGKPYDDFTINKFLAAISLQLHDMATAATAEEAAADSSAIPDEEKKAIYHDALMVSVQAKHYAKAFAYAQQLAALNGMDDTTTATVAIAYYQTGDVAHAKQYAQQSIDLAKAAGKQPDENMLIIIKNAQVASHDTAAIEGTAEQLVLTHGDMNSFAQLVDGAVQAQGMNDTFYLDLLRLKVLSGVATSDDYVQLGNAAYLQAYPVEAVNVLQQAIAQGKVSSGKVGDTLRKSRNDAAIDQRQIGSIAASAAKSRNGLEDVKLAEDYWGYGRFADAEVAAQRGVGKGGLKNPAEGMLILGMSQVAQGKYDQAIQTFSQVAGSQAAQKTAHVWSLYAQVKKGSGAPAPAH